MEKKLIVYKTSSDYFQTLFISFFNKLIDFKAWQISHDGKIRFGLHWANILLDMLEYLQTDNNNFDFFKEVVTDTNSKYYGLIKIDKIVAVTLSSHLLAEEIRDLYSERLNLNQAEEPQLIRLTNYYEFYNEETFNQIKQGDNVLIVNDVISTGKLNEELFNSLTEAPKEANVVAIFSLVDTRMDEAEYLKLPDDENRVTNYFNNSIKKKLVCIEKRYIPKYKSIDQIPKDLIRGREIDEVRINPVLNAPTPTIKKSEQIIKKLIYNDNSELKNGYQFLKNIYEASDSKNSLCVGHIENFGSHHPYFIDTKILFKSDTGKKLIFNLIVDVKNLDNEIIKERNKTHLTKIYERFERLKNENTELDEYDKKEIDSLINKTKKLNSEIDFKDNYDKFDVDFIVHASDSGFDYIKRYEFSNFLDKVGNKNDFQIIRMPRVMMSQEWGIPNIPDSYKPVFQGKRILILDSASCTGETLLNLIDSMCYLDVKKITVLSVITRIKDFQGEFLTRIHKINNNKVKFRDSSIPIDIYFGAHLNLPHYLANSNQCPHCKEIHDYKEILYKTNPPKSVEENIRYSRKFLEPAKVNDITCSTNPILAPYLVNNLDLSKMFQIRDELGKKEYQRAYNKYFKSELTSSAVIENDNVVNIDEFIGVLLHEPHLIEIIRTEYKNLYYKLKIIIDYNTLKFIPETKKNKQYKKNLLLKWDRTSLLFVYSFFFEDEFFIDSKRNVHVDMILDKGFLIKLFQYAQHDIEEKEKKQKKFDDSDSSENEHCLNFISYLIWIRQVHENIEQKNKEELKIKSTIIFNLLNDLRVNYRSQFNLHTNRIINKLVFHLSTLRISNENLSFSKATILLNKIYTTMDSEGSKHHNLYGKMVDLKTALQNRDKTKAILLWNKGLYDSLNEIKDVTSVLKPVFEAYKEYPHNKYLFDKNNSLFSFINEMDEFIIKNASSNEVHEESMNSLYYQTADMITYFLSAQSNFFEYALNYKFDFVKLWQKRVESINENTLFKIEPEDTFSMAPFYSLNIYMPIPVANYLIFSQIEVNLNSYADSATKIIFSWTEEHSYYILKIVNKKKKEIDAISIKSSFNGIAEWKKILPDFGISVTTSDLTSKSTYFETTFKISKKFICHE